MKEFWPCRLPKMASRTLRGSYITLWEPLFNIQKTDKNIKLDGANKAMVFPVVMYRCEKAERWKIDAFELWCWRRLLRVSWTARRSNQSILKEISPEYLLEELMLKLKLQYFGHLMGRTDSLEKTLMLGNIEVRRRWGWQRMSWLDWHEFEQALGDGKGQGSLVCCSPWGHKESDMRATEQQHQLFVRMWEYKKLCIPQPF